MGRNGQLRLGTPANAVEKHTGKRYNGRTHAHKPVLQSRTHTGNVGGQGSGVTRSTSDDLTTAALHVRTVYRTHRRCYYTKKGSNSYAYKH